MRFLAGGHTLVLLSLASVLVVCAGQRDLSKLPDALQDVMPQIPDASTKAANGQDSDQQAGPAVAKQDSQFATAGDAATAMKAQVGAETRHTSMVFKTAADAAAAMKKQAPALPPAPTGSAATEATATAAPVTAAPAPATVAPTPAPLPAPVIETPVPAPATPTPTPSPSPTPSPLVSPTPTPPALPASTPHESAENDKDQFPSLPSAANQQVAGPVPAPMPANQPVAGPVPAPMPTPSVPAPVPMPADCNSAVCLDSASQIDADCCDVAGTCSGDQFVYTQGGSCTNGDGTQGFQSCCRGVQAPGPAGPAPVMMTTDNPSHKGAAIGLGVVGGAAALAGIGVGIAHLVGNAQAHTSLTKACAVGTSVLELSDQSNYKVGDYLEVGYPTQIRKIIGLGSITLDSPLTVAVPKGGSVILHTQDAALAPTAPPATGWFGSRVVGPSAATPYGQPAGASNSSSDWSGSGSHMSPSSGSSGGNALAGFLVVCLLCAVVGVCAGIFFLIVKKKKRGKRDEMEDVVQPQYGHYPQAQGMQGPAGFAYTQAEGQPLMSPTYQPVPQMQQGYQMQPQSFQYQQPVTNMQPQYY